MTAPVPDDALSPDTEASAPPSKLTDHSFAPWRVPAPPEEAETTHALCAAVIAELEAYEQKRRLRQRQRKEADRLIFTRAVTALVCNALYYDLIDHVRREDRKTTENHHHGAFHIALSKRYLGAKYSHPVMSKALPAIVARMVDCGFLTLIQEGFKGEPAFNIPSRQTTIKAGPALVKLAADPAYLTDDLGGFGRDYAGEETIVLKLRDTWQTDSGVWKSAKESKTVPYTDTARTKALRAEMTTINDWLADSPLTLHWEALDRGFDPYQRYLRRYFTLGSKRFDCGGRLFGGFWLIEGMNQETRHRWITIAGEQVCTLDFGQMTPRILYALAKHPAPEGDCYRFPLLGHEDGKTYRDGIKQLFSAAPFLRSIPTRFPQGTREHFPNRITVEDVTTAILEAHAPIRGYLFTDPAIGHRVQNLESRIMVKTLLDIIHKTDIPGALPVHDGLVVPVSRHQEAREIMRGAFRECTGGMDAPVSLVI